MFVSIGVETSEENKQLALQKGAHLFKYLVLNTSQYVRLVKPLTGDRLSIGIFGSITYIGKPIFMYLKARNAASSRYFAPDYIDRASQNCKSPTISVIYSEFLRVDSSGPRLELA